MGMSQIHHIWYIWYVQRPDIRFLAGRRPLRPSLRLCSILTREWSESLCFQRVLLLFWCPSGPDRPPASGLRCSISPAGPESELIILIRPECFFMLTWKKGSCVQCRGGQGQGRRTWHQIRLCISLVNPKNRKMPLCFLRKKSFLRMD